MSEDDFDETSQGWPDEFIDFEAKVGPRNPPKHSRWQKEGPSPNPSGRPRKQHSLKHYLEQIAHRKIEVTDGGRKRTYTTLEVILINLKAKAISGHEGALKSYLWLMGISAAHEEPSHPKGVLIVGEKLTAEEWEEHARRYLEATAARAADKPSNPQADVSF